MMQRKEFREFAKIGDNRYGIAPFAASFEKMAKGDALRKLDKIWNDWGAEKRSELFDSNLNKRQEKLVDFFNLAMTEKISDRDMLFFIDNKTSEYMQKHGNNMSKGQLPALLFLSCTQASNVYEMFCRDMMTVDEKGVARGGAFGCSGRITENDEKLYTSDFPSIMYMLNHLKHHEVEAKKKRKEASGDASGKPEYTMRRDCAPYILCMGDCKNAEDSAEFNTVARVQIGRLANLANKSRKLGDHKTHNLHEDDKRNLNMNILDFHGDKLMLVPMVHDLATRKVYMVYTDDEGRVLRKEFSDFCRWIEDHTGAGKLFKLRNAVVAQNLESYKQHLQNASAGKISKRRGKCTNAECVDSRCANRTVSGVAKIIGAFPSDHEIDHMLQDSESDVLRVRLHTQCGYITTAARDFRHLLHELDKIMKAKTNTTEERHVKQLVQKIYEDLDGIMTGETNKLQYSKARMEKWAAQLGLDEHAMKVLRDTFCGIRYDGDDNDALDNQQMFQHMYERGIIVPRDERKGFRSGFTIKAAKEVREFLRKSGYPELAKENEEMFLYLVTEQLGRELDTRIHTRMEELLKSGKLKRKKDVYVHIESLKNGGIYQIPSKLDEKDIRNFVRERYTAEIGKDPKGHLKMDTSNPLAERLAA
jgi:hypothetical protein